MSRHLLPLYILRHGETEWNASGVLQGDLDSPLTARGLRQAYLQHRVLATQDLTGFRAYSSPQGRAMHTASIAVEGLIAPIRTDARLSEIGIGAWAGKKRSEVLSQVDDGAAPDNPFAFYADAPGGEGFEALARRCHGFLETLTQPAVVVTHEVTSRMLRLLVLGMEITALPSLPGGQGVVFAIENGCHRVLTPTV